MALTVNDLLQIPFFQNVVVEAGHGGLTRPITGTGIVDYEYAAGYQMPEQVFRKNDLLVSSLLFARDDPSLLQETIRSLAEVEAAALVYKSVFYKKLPKAAKAIADKFELPIIRIGFDYFIEDFLYQTNDRLRLENRLDEREALLRHLLEGTDSTGNMADHVRLLLPHQGRFLYAAYVAFDEPQGYHFFERLYQKPMAADRGQHTLLRYGNGFFWLASDQFNDEQLHRRRFEEDMAYMEVDLSHAKIGLSAVGNLPDELATTIQTGYHAALAARAMNRSLCTHEDMGLYQLLIPLQGHREVGTFADDYLAPLLAKNNSRTKELLITARSYVQNGGDLDATARELFCHKNTIRYRVGRLHELLDPTATEWVFWERLSTAVKVYLLQDKTDF